VARNNYHAGVTVKELRMGNCSICQHDKRHLRRVLAKRFSVSPERSGRHGKNHLEALQRSAAQRGAGMKENGALL
jgi:hypothetical protein